jgi:hypothetical protein
VHAFALEAEPLVEPYRRIVVVDREPMRRISPVVGSVDQRLHELGADTAPTDIVSDTDAEPRGVRAATVAPVQEAAPTSLVSRNAPTGDRAPAAFQEAARCADGRWGSQRPNQ